MAAGSARVHRVAVRGVRSRRRCGVLLGGGVGVGGTGGEALLWGIDAHNRSAHLGLALRPAFRGRGLGTDVVRVLCHYGFVVCGLHRLQMETLADNTAMLAAAESVGFAVEGTLRQAAWAYGAFADQTVLGLLAEDWRTDPRRSSE
ncbi:GNAT family protein [Actinomadura sp. NPDC048394]|uniref:GNAT family N-acetyltransferase n=1 Tax=Actinomadura sp. NPDC048394 TaxID=3158223 RepID=UPI0033E9CD23